jgi:two-component system sensor histidine kinase KdpD
MGYLLAVVLAPLLTLGLVAMRGQLNLTSDVLIFLVAVVVVALVGGFVPALLAAVLGSLLLNYYFTPPIHKWTIAEANNVLALSVFVVVAILVSSVVDIAARRTRQAARASAESELLTTTAGSVLRGERAVTAVLDRVREAFAMDSVTLLERRPGKGGRWAAVAYSGEPALAAPDGADVEVPVTDTLSLALRGPAVSASDRRVLAAFATYAGVALEQQRLSAEAEAARPIAEADRMRTALLAAVSHDLRTPLASAKAAVTSLRSPDIRWTDEDRDELLATADESLDRLAHLVDNLLDMSRLQAGALAVFPRPAGLEEIVARALDDLGPPGRQVVVDIPDSLPEVRVDPAILERVIVNLTTNALRYSPAGQPPLLTASALGDRVELRVADRGPGIPEPERDRVFVPFQRLGDTDNTTGVGLGLALSRGLTEAMDGTLEPEETPGGGLTMVLSLPAAPMPDHTGQGDPGRRERDQAPSPQVAPAAPATPSAEPATLSAEPVTSSAEPATPAEPVTPASAPATPPAAAEGGRLAT